MGCESTGDGLTICRPSPYGYRAEATDCPGCHRRRTWIGRDEGWYGFSWVCLGCGGEARADGFHADRTKLGAEAQRRICRRRREFAAWLIAGSPRRDLSEDAA